MFFTKKQVIKILDKLEKLGFDLNKLNPELEDLTIQELYNLVNAREN